VTIGYARLGKPRCKAQPVAIGTHAAVVRSAFDGVM